MPQVPSSVPPENAPKIRQRQRRLADFQTAMRVTHGGWRGLMDPDRNEATEFGRED